MEKERQGMPWGGAPHPPRVKLNQDTPHGSEDRKPPHMKKKKHN